jgi:metal-responsive CopG/Arc/MetJ family transcriptional regulator
MKTVVSIPDKIFADAERLADLLKKSRSQLYADAIKEYLLRHEPDAITEAINRTVAEADEGIDPWVAAASAEVLRRVEW